VIDLMCQAKRDRLGLVAFAATAFLQCPLTLDAKPSAKASINWDVALFPKEDGLGRGLETAQSAFKDETENHRVLVLLTDGEDHDSGALEAAEKAANAGLRIFTVGIGTPNGNCCANAMNKGT